LPAFTYKCLFRPKPDNLFTKILMQRSKGAKTQGFWSAVAERSGDTAFRLRTELPKRRGASLPAAIQKDLVVAWPR
jgi:hypothetical protein